MRATSTRVVRENPPYTAGPIMGGIYPRYGTCRNRSATSERSGTPLSEPLAVWIDQDLCTGDGLCVQYAPEVFEFDVDGLAYVKDPKGELLGAPGARAEVPAGLRRDVISSAKECPGACIHVLRTRDDTEVAGPEAGSDS